MMLPPRDSNLVMALVQSMNSQAELLRTARQNLEATVFLFWVVRL